MKGHTHDESKDAVKDNSAPVQIMRLTITERGAVILALVFVTLIAGVAWVRSENAVEAARISEREFKQVQIQLMYANAIMLREGLVQPGDMVYGPEGNLEYRQHELKRKEK